MARSQSNTPEPQTRRRSPGAPAQSSRAELLSSYQTFRSRDAEELRAFLDTQQFAVAIPARDSTRVNACLNGVHVATRADRRAGEAPASAAPWLPATFRVPGSRSGVYLGYLEYGCAIELRGLPTRDDYRLLLPIRGGVEAVDDSDTVSCARGGAVVTSPFSTKAIRLGRGTALLNLFLKGPELHRQLASLLGEACDEPLRFAPLMDAGRSYGRSLWSYAATAIRDIEYSGSLLHNPLAASALEQLIILGLLHAHPHNYSAALQRKDRSIAPRSVRRSIDYIRANLDAPITIADLTALSGVAGKTLWTHFREFAGTSPMRYLRNARLQRVHQELTRCDPETSVTDVAMKWGFAHMGRFSGQYRERFGESPSETLKRRR